MLVSDVTSRHDRFSASRRRGIEARSACDGRLAARRAVPCACVLAVVLAVLGLVFRNSISWGDVPTWVLAVTTLLAFAAAASRL